MNHTRLSIAKPDIVTLFNQLPARVFRQTDIARILSENREFWRLAQRETVTSFLNFLRKNAGLRRVQLKFPSRPETRYVWGDVPMFELLQKVSPKAYFSHFTAMQLHEWTDQIPKTIFMNDEQSPKPPPSMGLAQERIDAAFKRSPRRTSRIAEYEGYRVCMLSGKQSGQLGVIDGTAQDGSKVRVTNTERTLIDITVRSYYAGGVSEVLEAFRRAQSHVSVNRLCAYLSELNYVYPYHQAIGFYLERAGNYRDNQVRLLQKPGMEFDFYLAYQMAETSYSKTWMLHVPKGL